MSAAPVMDRLYSAEILYKNLQDWLKREPEECGETESYFLGKYCCKQAWAAAEGRAFPEMGLWLDRSRMHGYRKKYYSKATMIASCFGLPFGSRLKRYMLYKFIRSIQS